MGSADMSKRTHLWIRLAALAVIAAAAYLPRGTSATASPTAQASHVAPVTARISAQVTEPVAESTEIQATVASVATR